MELLRLDESFEDLLFSLEVGRVTEKSILVLFEPLFCLDAIAAQVDEVDKHDKEDDYDGDRDGNLDTQCSFAIVAG